MPAEPASPAVPALSTAPGRTVAADPPGGRGAWLAWSIGVTVYVLAVVHRTSLGVAGLDAATRFGINASALSTFSILQVLVYAGMQIPVGLLVDRFGPRRVLSVGLVLLTAGQLGFAFATAFGPALASRAVLGCGDAMTFVSVLRIAARWFPLRQGPFIAQLTGLVGTVGNLVSTLVLSQVLHSAGWTPTFATTGLVGIGVLVLTLAALREAPPGTAPLERAGSLPLVQQIRSAWAEPGTRLGMWVHFTTAFPASTCLFLWGMPFLMQGQGLSRPAAGAMLSLIIASGMVFAVGFGQMMSRRPSLRTPTVFAVVLGTGVLWACALAWPGGHVPMWLLVVLFAAMGSNGPASLIGLDYARPVNPPERIGTASGIVNMGGFAAAVLALLGVGVLLDAASPGTGGDAYTTGAFRVAFCALYLPMALGLIQILRLRKPAALREAPRQGRLTP